MDYNADEEEKYIQYMTRLDKMFTDCKIGDSDIDKILITFGYAPDILDKGLFISVPIKPSGIAADSIWSFSEIEASNSSSKRIFATLKNHENTSIRVSMGIVRNGRDAAKINISFGRTPTMAGRIFGQPRVGHMAYSSYMDIALSYHNIGCRLEVPKGSPKEVYKPAEGEKWPSIVADLAREIVKTLSIEPGEDDNVDPAKFKVSVTPKEAKGEYAVSVVTDLDDVNKCWVKLNTETGRLSFSSITKKEILLQNGEPGKKLWLMLIDPATGKERSTSTVIPAAGK
jgi:hypothetical protein